jgi:hypothetical protein
MTYDPLYDRPVALASLAGTYSLVQGDLPIGTNITIAANGSISGTVSGGSVTGTLSSVDPGRNLFSLTLQIPGCGTGNPSYAFWSDGRSANFNPNSLYFMWSCDFAEIAVLASSAGAVEIVNNSDRAITGVWLMPDPESSWGTSLLTGEIAAGATMGFANINPGAYDCRVQLADNSYLQNLDFPVSSGSTAVISFTP